jgi:hypothetical protein
MWLMMTTGALSIVQRTRIAKNDDRTLVVRSRREEWLESFRRWCPEMGPALHVSNRDYQWRAYAKPDDVALAVARYVLSIDYGNFKSATSSAEHGLKDPKLRSSLHSAYNKVWNNLLDAGDGTSVYDFKSTGTGSWYTGIEACRRWGHWWPKGAKVCKDCEEPNPSYPAEGPEKVYPEGYPKKLTAPARKKGKQASAKAYVDSVLAAVDEFAPGHSPWDKPTKSTDDRSILKGSDACAGSWTAPLEDTVELSVPANGYQESGVCSFCGQRRPLNGSYELQLHWADEEEVA